MAKQLTVDDILPLVASLTPKERIRLLRLIASLPTVDPAAVYGAMPPGDEEFSVDEDALAWEGDGWEKFD